MEFPSALLGVALGTVLLPSLAKHHSDANHDQYSSLLDWGLRLAFLLALPAAVALWLLALPLVTTLYQYGKFTVNDVWQTRAALLGYSVGLLGLILVKILAPGFYARQNIKTPVRIAFFTVFVTQTLALILMWRIGHAGLTLATSIGACVNAGAAVLVPAQRRLLPAATGLVPVPVQARRRAGRAGGAAVRAGGPAGRSGWRPGRGSASGGLRASSRRASAAYFATLFLLGFRLGRLRSPRRRRTERRRRARLLPCADCLRCGQRGLVQSAYR